MSEPLNTNKGNERSSIVDADDVRACVLGEGGWLVFFKVKINFKKWEIWKKKSDLLLYILTSSSRNSLIKEIASFTVQTTSELQAVLLCPPLQHQW